MAEELLVDAIEAGREFLAEFDKSYPVSVAYWILPAEADRWRLHIASERIAPETRGAAYGIANSLAMRPPRRLDWMQITLLSWNDPLASKVAEIRGIYGDQFPHRNSGRLIAGMPIEGLYIYESRDCWSGQTRQAVAAAP